MASDYSKGWDAAALGESCDMSKPISWIRGWRDYHRRLNADTYLVPYR